MVNAAKVNGGCPCLARAVFCEIFRVSGRFLCFKNPVKYIGGSRVDHAGPHEVSKGSYFITIYQ